jgi:uncharacterized membrane protein
MYSGQGQTPSPQPSGYTPQRTQFEFIGESFQLLQKQLGAWVGAAAVAFAAILAVVAPFYASLGAIFLQMLRRGDSKLDPSVFVGLIGPMLFMILGLTILGTVTHAGLQMMGIKQLRGHQLKVGDIFGTFSKFGSVFGLNFLMVLVHLAVGIICGLVLQFLGPFANLVSMIPGAVLMGLFSLALPLVLDQNMSPLDALKESVAKVRSELWIVTAYIAILTAISQLGGIACLVGALFTIPILSIGSSLLYRAFYPERFGAADLSEGN